MKPQIFYPGKILDRHSMGPYQLELRQLGRLDGQPELYNIAVTRLYTYVATHTCRSIGEAMRAFEQLKELAITNCGCDAFGIEPVGFDLAA